MKQTLLATKFSMKMMWGCMALALALVVVVVALAANAYVLLFIIPCMFMMGAMVWMMMGGMGSGTRGGNKT